jgi:trimeric autotransporter adhesin
MVLPPTESGITDKKNSSLFPRIEAESDPLIGGPHLRAHQRSAISACFIALVVLAVSAYAETPARKTTINGPAALALDNNGHLFVVELKTNRVRRIDLQKGTIKTVAGNGKECCYKDGKAATAVSLDFILAIAVDSEGNLFIADFQQVRKVDAHSGLISTAAGNGETGNTIEGSMALWTSFQQIEGLAVDSAGSLFIDDAGQGKIFKVSSAEGVVSTVGGNGKTAFSGDGGPAVDASFLFVGSMAFDFAGNLFIADVESCRIRRIDHKTGFIGTVAVTGGTEQNCPPQPGRIPWQPSPSDPAVDSMGNVYFVQGSEDIVARAGLSPETQSIIAGSGKRGFSGDGRVATAATFSSPSGLAVDSEGNIFISDFGNNRIRRVDAKTKIITTVAGNGLPHRIDFEM